MPANPTQRPASRTEIVAVLVAAIRAGGPGTLSRDSEGFLAAVAAEHLADRLELAGFTVMRAAHACEGPGGGEAPPQPGLWDSPRDSKEDSDGP